MPNVRLPAAALSIVLMTAACASSAAPTASTPSTSPPPPTPSSTRAGIDHPTGATDVVLRIEQSGGFVPIDFFANQAPEFTLFGDGRVVFQQLLQQAPQPGADGITHGNPWRIAQLDAGQTEELLKFALGPGGLGAARDSYIQGGLADVPNTIFTVRAGGLNKTVVVLGLGMERPGNPDEVAFKAFQALADRLRDFDRGGSVSTQVYSATAYRGVLVERDPLAPQTAIAWPWPAMKPADFKEGAGDGTGPQLPHRSLTPDEVKALGVDGFDGGIQGLFIKSPDGKKTYSLTLRPLLPDEKE